jgi:hypothetical protein
VAAGDAETREVTEEINEKTGEIKKKVRKTFESKTPAQHLGIFKAAISMEYLLEHC